MEGGYVRVWLEYYSIIVIDLDGLWQQCGEMMKYIAVSSLCVQKQLLLTYKLSGSKLGTSPQKCITVLIMHTHKKRVCSNATSDEMQRVLNETHGTISTDETS